MYNAYFGCYKRVTEKKKGICRTFRATVKIEIVLYFSVVGEWGHLKKPIKSIYFSANRARSIFFPPSDILIETRKNRPVRCFRTATDYRARRDRLPPGYRARRDRFPGSSFLRRVKSLTLTMVRDRARGYDNKT